MSPAENAAWNALLSARTAVIRRLDGEMRARHELALTSYEVLLHLAWAPDRRLRMSQLADSVLLTPGGVTRLVGRLVDEGLVRRVDAGEDRRGAYAELTASGLERLRQAHPTHLEGLRRYFVDRLSSDELAVLSELGRRLAEPE